MLRHTCQGYPQGTYGELKDSTVTLNCLSGRELPSLGQRQERDPPLAAELHEVGSFLRLAVLCPSLQGSTAIPALEFETRVPVGRAEGLAE